MIHRPKTAPDVLIIDGLNMAFKAFYAVKALAYDGKETAVLKGMLGSLGRVIDEFVPRHVVFVWEGRGSKQRRLDIIPEYKGNRTPMEEVQRKSFFGQVDIMQELIYYFGLSQIAVNTFEADDAINSLARQLADEGKSSVIISSDKDLLQIISPKIKWYDTTKAQLMTHRNFKLEMGLKLDRFIDFKCLVKDTSDNLEGVTGIGEKTALKLLNDSTLQAYMDGIPVTKGRTAILFTDEGKKMVETMRKVVDLEHFRTPEFDLAVLEQFYGNPSAPDWEEIWDILEENGFFATLKRFEEFQEPYKTLEQETDNG